MKEIHAVTLYQLTMPSAGLMQVDVLPGILTKRQEAKFVLIV